MEFHDSFLVFVCIFIPVAHCGRITDYLLLQRHLEEYLHSRTSIHEDISAPFYSKVKMWTNMLHHLNNTRWRTKQTAGSGIDVYQTSPTKLSVIQSLSPLYSPFLQLYDNWDSARDKRQYLKHTDFNVELLLVVDNSIFRSYLKDCNYRVDKARKKITEYYSILLAMKLKCKARPTQAQSLPPKMIQAARFQMSGDNTHFEKYHDYLTETTIKKSKVSYRTSLYKSYRLMQNETFDLLYSFIEESYILSKRQKQVDGLGYISSMCNVAYGESASIIQDQGDFQSAAVIAHELGHSLGATHDGDRENKDCPSAKNYVMAPQVSRDPSVASNAYHFSKCSVRQMKDFLSSSQSKCLYNSPRITRWSYSLKHDPPGQRFDADQQCEKSFGPDSTFCELGATQSSVCSRLWCTSPQESAMTCRSNNRLMALPGTSCGDNMQCHLGECVATFGYASHLQHLFYTRIRLRNDNCPMGDGNPTHCRAIINASPYLCDRPRLGKYCCESCGNHR